MDLPRFAVVRKNVETDSWELMSMDDLMKYEQAKAVLDRCRSKGYTDCYLVSVGFIAGPSTNLEA
jgi:hypothetical protein